MKKLHPEVKNALDKLEQDIAEAVESNRELNKKYFLLQKKEKKAIERLTATNNHLKQLLSTNAIKAEGSRTKTHHEVTENNLLILRKP